MMRLVFIPMLLWLGFSAAALSADQPYQQVVSAYQQRQSMPQFGTPLTVARAYQIQKQAVEHLLDGAPAAGFKAGLTSVAGQEKFAVNHPVAGVLLAGSRLQPAAAGYRLALSRYNKLMLEIELGFEMAAAITEPLASVDELKRQLKAVYPVIELPDLGFADMSTLTASDIIANNVAARTVIVGAGQSPARVDVNTLAVKLFLNETLLLEGVGSDAMGDQWQALLWLVNRSIANGWTIEPGQILITGALGKMRVARPGRYTAEFAGLGRIDWVIE